jgi:hypothetical protein
MLKEQILKDVSSIDNPQLLNQIFEYLQVVKHTAAQVQPNRDAVLKFAGTLSDTEAKKLRKVIDEEFSQTEGEW